MSKETGTNGPTITVDHINSVIVDEQYHVFAGTTLTVCVLTLRNGFTVTGESACVDPANFDAEKGRNYAREQAFGKIWMLEGYLLQERLSRVPVDHRRVGTGAEIKLYQSHKKVHARPMCRGEYNAYRGWKVPADENPEDPGYLVIYNKDTVDHYESWSPKHVFDDGYTEVV